MPLEPKLDYFERSISTLASLVNADRLLAGARSPDSKWIFRGVKDSRWGLQTSIERAMADLGEERLNTPLREKQLLLEFQRRLHHYTPDKPEERDILEWLALMQHYGAPTRLLDWTYSFHVALFFAISSFEQSSEPVPYCAVWALDTKHFSNKRQFPEVYAAKRQKLIQPKRKGPNWERLKSSQELLNSIALHVLNNPKAAVLPVNPFRLNDRLAVQQGLFLMAGRGDITFEENLRQTGLSPENLIQFKISNAVDFRRDTLFMLHRMNINHATLFPGLGGFAQSLHSRLAFPEILRDLRAEDI